MDLPPLIQERMPYTDVVPHCSLTIHFLMWCAATRTKVCHACVFGWVKYGIKPLIKPFLIWETLLA